MLQSYCSVWEREREKEEKKREKKRRQMSIKKWFTCEYMLNVGKLCVGIKWVSTSKCNEILFACVALAGWVCNRWLATASQHLIQCVLAFSDTHRQFSRNRIPFGCFPFCHRRHQQQWRRRRRQQQNRMVQTMYLYEMCQIIVKFVACLSVHLIQSHNISMLSNGLITSSVGEWTWARSCCGNATQRNNGYRIFWRGFEFAPFTPLRVQARSLSGQPALYAPIHTHSLTHQVLKKPYLAYSFAIGLRYHFVGTNRPESKGVAFNSRSICRRKLLCNGNYYEISLLVLVQGFHLLLATLAYTHYPFQNKKASKTKRLHRDSLISYSPWVFFSLSLRSATGAAAVVVAIALLLWKLSAYFYFLFIFYLCVSVTSLFFQLSVLLFHLLISFPILHFHLHRRQQCTSVRLTLLLLLPPLLWFLLLLLLIFPFYFSMIAFFGNVRNWFFVFFSVCLAWCVCFCCLLSSAWVAVVLRLS